MRSAIFIKLYIPLKWGNSELVGNNYNWFIM